LNNPNPVSIVRLTVTYGICRGGQNVLIMYPGNANL